MTRKEMIIAIANDAGCSRRLVRKKLFERCVELKKTHPEILFYKAFLDKNTDWVRNAYKNWETKNRFEVFGLPSGMVVMFYGIERIYDGDIWYTDCGARLWTWKHFRTL